MYFEVEEVTEITDISMEDHVEVEIYSLYMQKQLIENWVWHICKILCALC